MAQRYLSEFYSYRAVVPAHRRVVAGPQTPLEQQIRIHVLKGNIAFHQGRYTAALDAYLAAWGELPRLIVSAFPDVVATLEAEKLLAMDLTAHYAAASTSILALRDGAAPDVPINPSIDPPGELVELTNAYTSGFDAAEHAFTVARASIERDEPELAHRKITSALRLAPDSAQLQADGAALLAAVAFRSGDFEQATGQLNKALEAYQSLGDPNGITAMRRNLSTVTDLHRRGTPQPGGESPPPARGIGGSALAAANLLAAPRGDAGPFIVTSLLVKGAGGQWSQTTSTTVPAEAQWVLHNGGTVKVALDDNGASLTQALLEPRVEATTLVGLQTHLWEPLQFVSYLAHVGGFVLPLALGDTYEALGDHAKAVTYYTKVRDYAFLNKAIERPMVWRKLAKAYLTWGNSLYRQRDMAGARDKYERILRLTDDGFELTGVLYAGGFADLQAETMAFLESGDRRSFDALDYGRRLILMEAEANLKQILANINYLGFSEDVVPIHSWQHLQNIARYFANQAIQAERAYISFKDTAEKEAFTRLNLEQAVDAQNAALDVERQRVAAAKEQQRVAELSADQAQLRLDNAKAQRDEYEAISAKLVKLEEINGWATGPMDKAEVSESWADVLGIEPGKYDTYQIVRIVARQRAQLNRQLELANLERGIAEQEANLVVAQAQVDVAREMVAVAEASEALAELRLDQAEAQLEFFDAQEFTPELWDNLAQAQRDLSQRYLDWAIGAAFLMERAFEVEYDVEVNRIRFDYARSDLHGLLGGDFLQADIDQFSYDRILQTDKQLPAKVALSLSSRYPFQFQHQFKRTGRMEFQTLLEDFDRWQPGEHLRKLRRVEVVVEGLIGPAGLHGTLSNAGISAYRDRSGARKTRVQKPETMVLSRYDLRHDGFVFTVADDVLDVFENSGVASGWTLELPPGSNDIDYRDITDVHLVLYYDTYHSDAVAAVVSAELAAAAVHEHTLGLGLRFQYPDAFFGFGDSGEITFEVGSDFLPYHHTEPEVLDAYLLVQTDPGVPAEALHVEVRTGSGVDVADETDAEGMIATGEDDEPLNAARGQPLLDTWTVAIPAEDNAAAFDAGFEWQGVHNVFLFVEYDYTPRETP